MLPAIWIELKTTSHLGLLLGKIQSQEILVRTLAFAFQIVISSMYRFKTAIRLAGIILIFKKTSSSSTFEREYCINDGLFDETTTRAQLLSDLTSQLAAFDLNISYAFVLSYPEQGDSTGFYTSLDNIMTALIGASNRVQGMIVYDSYVRQGLLNAALSQEVIWCPSIQKDNLQVCNVLSPLEISGGPISLGLKPVFPSLELYEDEDDSSIWPEAVSYDFWSVKMSSDVEQFSEFLNIDPATGEELWNHYYTDINDLTTITPTQKLEFTVPLLI